MAAPASGPIPPALRELATRWMSARLKALSALMRRIEAGECLTSPLMSPRDTAAPPPRGLRAPLASEEHLPRGFGWMRGFGPNVERDGQAFVDWLNEPVMTAKVMIAPEQMARVIGPILTATGQRRPEWFPMVAGRRHAIRQTCVASCDGGSELGANAPDAGDIAVPDMGSRIIIPCANPSVRGQEKTANLQPQVLPPPLPPRAHSKTFDPKEIFSKMSRSGSAGFSRPFCYVVIMKNDLCEPAYAFGQRFRVPFSSPRHNATAARRRCVHS